MVWTEARRSGYILSHFAPSAQLLCNKKKLRMTRWLAFADRHLILADFGPKQLAQWWRQFDSQELGEH